MVAIKKPTGAGLMGKTADDLVIELITETYQPASEPGNGEIEHFSTMDLIEQFAPITDITKSFLADELAERGFTLVPFAGEYRWKLKHKTTE
jgi:hypothetical protein